MTKTTKRPSAGPPSERRLSRETGISRSVLWRAKQVASIPEAEFEAMVESDSPPTVTQLVNYARTGTKTNPKRGHRHCPHCGGEL